MPTLCERAGEPVSRCAPPPPPKTPSDASFAGLQDTFLWVLTRRPMLAARARVLGQPVFGRIDDLSPQARHRRGRRGDGGGGADDGRRACAGVMFTRRPTTGDKSVITIEGAWGLGQRGGRGRGHARPLGAGQDHRRDLACATSRTSTSQHRPSGRRWHRGRERGRTERAPSPCLTDARARSAARGRRGASSGTTAARRTSSGRSTQRGAVLLLQAGPRPCGRRRTHARSAAGRGGSADARDVDLRRPR